MRRLSEREQQLIATRDALVGQRLHQGGLRLVKGSVTMLQDEFAEFEAALRAQEDTDNRDGVL